MQFARFLVDEERHGHAPLALARQGPVGTIGDHAAQARLAPVRIEARVVDAAQGGRAQGLGRLHALEARRLVHGGEPLRAGAVDDRRLVAPAVHVAVHVVFAVEQRARFLDLLDDLGIGLPDHHAAEERQRGRVFAVGHHRREDLLVLHAVVAAGVEVLDAVGGRAVHDAGAGVERHVFAEIDRRQPLVERVVERDQFERLALARGERLAGELVAREAGVLQVRGQDQQPALGRDQVVDVLRMRVQRLVGGYGPGRGGPDDDPALVGRQLGQAERLGDFFRLGEAQSRRRWRSPSCPRTRLRLRPAPSRSRSTSSPASGRGRRSPSPVSCPACGFRRPRCRRPWSGRDGPSRRARPGAGNPASAARSAPRHRRGTGSASSPPAGACRAAFRSRARSACRGSPSRAHRPRRSRPGCAT